MRELICHTDSRLRSTQEIALKIFRNALLLIGSVVLLGSCLGGRLVMAQDFVIQDGSRFISMATAP